MAQFDHVAPDGGWGWWVVLSVFVVNILIDGTIGTFGIFYPYIMTEFLSSPALTSLTGSLIPAVYMMSAPITGVLIQRYDCRRVSIAGGIIASCGIVIASMSRNIGEFAVCYGVLGGLGIGMNSLCGHLMVNTYFSKKRGIANGIVSSGAGMGVFILAPLLQYLLENYSWRGTMLIYSGCILQYCVCGMLMRPYMSMSQQLTVQQDSVTGIEESTSDECNDESSPSKQPLLKPRAVKALQDEVTTKQDVFHSQEYEQKATTFRTYFSSLFHINNEPKISKGKSLPNLSVHRKEHTLSMGSCELRYRQTVVSPHLKPLDRKDIFYSGSIYNLKEFKDSKSVEDFVEKMTVDDKAASVPSTSDKADNCCLALRRSCRGFTSRLVDFSVFRHSVYVPVLLGGVFVQMGQFIPSTFLPNYCLSIGLTSDDVTTILWVYGSMNILGRLIAGFLANMESISTLWLCTFGNFMCGVACGLFPVCKTVLSLCMFAAGFGCFIGFFGPLQVLIMVEYLGLERLTSAMGILQLAKGPAALFGPPLAGLVYQWTQDYGMSVVVAAAMFTLSATCQSTVPLINKIQQRQVKNLI